MQKAQELTAEKRALTSVLFGCLVVLATFGQAGARTSNRLRGPPEPNRVLTPEEIAELITLWIRQRI